MIAGFRVTRVRASPEMKKKKKTNFLGSFLWLDSGTYVRAGSTELEAREYWIPILGNLTRNRVWGGEACAVSSFSTCSQALEEAEQLHATYLNRLYNPVSSN